MWPAMLMAEGSFQLPDNVPANCFLNIQFPGEQEQKISKSRGTAIWIRDYLKEYDPDPLRYYLSQVSLENQRAAFKFDDFLTRNNDELVAALGNLVHRTMTFTHKYFGGRVPERGGLDDLDREQLAMAAGLADAVAAELENFRFKAGIECVMEAARASNRYFDRKEPWVQRKEDMAACGTTVNVLLNTIRTLGVVMEPYLPFAAAKVARMLGLPVEDLAWARAAQSLAEGSQLGEPEILFRKLDAAAILGENEGEGSSTE
jgi:methionyl-tRNA synthetase